jgi:hypothetical protein
MRKSNPRPSLFWNNDPSRMVALHFQFPYVFLVRSLIMARNIFEFEAYQPRTVWVAKWCRPQTGPSTCANCATVCWIRHSAVMWWLVARAVASGKRHKMSLRTAAARIADLWVPLRWPRSLCPQSSQDRHILAVILTWRRRSLPRRCARHFAST